MKRTYLEPLTWLRAAAAFFVVISHTLRASEVQYSPADAASYFLPLNLLDLGSFGVCLFFALSGCTLFISNNTKLIGVGDIGRFYFKRFMRIWPAFAVSMLAYIIFIEFFRIFYTADRNLWIGQFLQDYSPANVFQYLSLTFNITGPRGLFVGPYWSLPVEFQYYLLLPFALLVMRVRYLGFVTPIIFGVILLLLNRESVFHFNRNEVFTMGFTFFGGVFLAKIHENTLFRLEGWVSLLLFSMVVFFVGLVENNFVVVPLSVPFVGEKWNLYGVLALLSLALALFIKPKNYQSRILSLVHKYGEISYSVYLFHMLFVGTAVLLIVNFEIYGSTPKLLFVLFFSLVGSYIFSIYSYRLIEKPSIEFAKKMTKPKPMHQAGVNPV